MRRSMTLLAGAAAATALLVSGCSAGQIAETAEKVAAVPGVSGDVDTPAGTLSVRNAVVVYDNPEGYPAGSDAALDVRIFNDTDRAVTVTVTSPAAKAVTLAGGATPSPAAPASPTASPTGQASPGVSPTAEASPGATPSGTASPAATASPTPEPAAQPATVEIPARGYTVLSQPAGEYLRLLGLTEALKPGETVELRFDFGGASGLTLAVPVGIPLSPAPRASADVAEEGH